MKAWLTRHKQGSLQLWKYKYKPHKTMLGWCFATVQPSYFLTDSDLPEGVNPQWSDDEPIEVELKIKRV